MYELFFILLNTMISILIDFILVYFLYFHWWSFLSIPFNDYDMQVLAQIFYHDYNGLLWLIAFYFWSILYWLSVINYLLPAIILKSSSIIISLFTNWCSFSLFNVINLSSVIAQLVWIMICYEIRANASVDTWSYAANSLITSLAILFSLDNIWSINLDKCLDQANIYLDVNYETFSLLVLTNILLYEGSTMFDCSLIIGNQINTCLSGLMVVFTLYYQVARHLYLIFISIFV